MGTHFTRQETRTMEALDVCAERERQIVALKSQLQQERERVEVYRKMAEHYHVAAYIDDRLLDACGKCGLDLRDAVHIRKAALEEPEVEDE